MLSRFLAASPERQREVATRSRVHHLANLGGCPAQESEDPEPIPFGYEKATDIGQG
jgi:hypothetical protein